MPRKRSAGHRKQDSSTPATEAKAERMVNRLRDRYQIGRKANRSKLTTSEFSGEHGLSEHTVRKLKRFATEYSVDELEALCQLRRPNGLPFHVGYVGYLLVINDKVERKKIQKQAAAEGWSAQTLAARIPSKYRRSTGGHGRPMQRPTSLSEGLSQIAEEAGRLSRRSEVLRTDVIPAEHGKRMSQAKRKQVQNTIEILEKLRRELAATERELGSVLE
jgi:hypothetical protein